MKKKDQKNINRQFRELSKDIKKLIVLVATEEISKIEKEISRLERKSDN